MGIKKNSTKGTPLWKALFKERRVPYRYQWIKALPKLKFTYYPQFFSSLDYKNLFKTENPEAGINNGIVSSLVLQLYGSTFMKDTIEVCKKIGMSPFLAFGTLLGHHRDNGFIKHDHDMDIGLLEKDFIKINNLKKGMKEKGYRVRHPSGYKYEISFSNPRFPGISLDFFIFYKHKNEMVYAHEDIVKKKLHFYAFPLEIFEKFEKTKFLGKIDVLVPSQTERFLRLSYGDWKTPNKKFKALSDHPNLKKIVNSNFKRIVKK